MLCEDIGCLTLFIHVIKNFIKIRNQGASASNLTCTYRYYRIPLLLQFLIICFAWCKVDVSFSVKTSLTDSSSLAKHVVFKTLLKRNILDKIFEANTRFCIIIYVLLIYTTLCIFGPVTPCNYQETFTQIPVLLQQPQRYHSVVPKKQFYHFLLQT